MAGRPPGPDAPGPLIFVEGEGAWLTDLEGRRYLDGMSGQWCVNAGYGRLELAGAAADQLSRLAFYPLTRGHLPAIALGERLNGLLGGDRAMVYANSGSEANEVAFKLARQYHQLRGEPSRFKIISRYRAYHGSTLGALAASGQSLRRLSYEPLPAGFVQVPPPDTLRQPPGTDLEAYGLRCAAELEQTIRYEMAETVAAVIMEPIITGGGLLDPAGQLPARGRGGLPAPRGAPDRGRGHLRVRAHRHLVRLRALGRAAGHRDDGQGHHQRLLPPGRGGGHRRGVRGLLARPGRPRAACAT